MRNFNLLKSRTVAVVTGAVVVVGLGTTGATAAGLINSDDIRNNSIAGKDISRNAIGSTELGRNAVKSHHLANGAIGFKDLRPFVQNHVDDTDEVNGLRQQVDTLKAEVTELREAPQGVPGYEPLNAEKRWAPGAVTETVAQCVEGKVALGGGYEIDGTANGSAAETEIVDNGPVYADGVANAWRVAGVPSGQVNVKAWVICADITEAEADEVE